MPGTARPLIKDMPSRQRIHLPDAPEGVKANPGTCSICGMTLVPGDPMATADYRMRSSPSRAAKADGQKTKFRIDPAPADRRARHASSAEVHDRLFHLFIVSRDMTQFFHEHPVLEKDGSFTSSTLLPAAGHTCCSATSCRSAAGRR